MGLAQSKSIQVARQRLLRGLSPAKTPSLELQLASVGKMTTDDMLRVQALKERHETSTEDILSSLQIASEDEIAQAHADRVGANVVDPILDPPDVRLLDRFGPVRALKLGLLPWRMRNGCVVILCASPAVFELHKAQLAAHFGTVSLAITTPTAIQNSIENVRQDILTERAERRVDGFESCRTLNLGKIKALMLLVLVAFAVGIALAPSLVWSGLALIAIAFLFLNTVIKVACALIFLEERRASSAEKQAPNRPGKWPVVTVLVALFDEREIAEKLVNRLKRLNYPKELLDVILVTEEGDQTTQNTLTNTKLPPWIRTLSVPPGGPMTKPRALNYALDFCKGSIVGVYDAEDAPEAYQIKHFVRIFDQRDDRTACLQGILDFYNARTNWMARCFAVEYATWFRIILPGLERLQLAVPLGGTTLFFRKHILEKLGAWDAHNVTEDADLGIRLARYGYKTELVPTVTLEEANCRAWPWIRQRSRWLKGYAMTWITHNRAPRTLWRDLGPWKFFGFQILFGGTLIQFILAPVLWSFWLGLLGFWHPLSSLLGPTGFHVLAAFFLTAEILTVTVGMMAVSRPAHKYLIPWVPTLHFYFPLATAAVYKAVLELVYKPFFWDKTAHGIYEGDKKPVIKADHLNRSSSASQTRRLDEISQLHRRHLRSDQQSPRQ